MLITALPASTFQWRFQALCAALLVGTALLLNTAGGRTGPIRQLA